MSDRSARWVVVEDSFTGDEPLIIKDVGPWDKHLSITNDVEGVVKRLLEAGTLSPGQRLLYYDSDDQLDEIVILNGEFHTFEPGPR